ncbi:hypothetical protein EC973_000231 [Apophysomyces ossiformis]|uniref:Methyltransferase domain-containing protein n=1 Tax=Apophysomyces ossiformis TaxID=679940 RepID=A0A8H7EV94_9FUNG|nr:hypothetical protein EC973_000231 [Apophysomyces ossiformis]
MAWPSLLRKDDIRINGRTFSSPVHKTYCLPRDDEEADRLSALHSAIKFVHGDNLLGAAKAFLSESIDVARVLDVGCGAGTWIMDTAADYEDHEFIGIDVADMFPKSVMPPNVHFIKHDILKGLPFPDRSMDIVHMRLMQLAFRTYEWPFIVSEIYRVLKPGGYVQIVEAEEKIAGNRASVAWFERFYAAATAKRIDLHLTSRLPMLLENNQFDMVDARKDSILYATDCPLESTFRWSTAKAMEVINLKWQKELGFRSKIAAKVAMEAATYGLRYSDSYVDYYVYIAQKPSEVLVTPLVLL